MFQLSRRNQNCFQEGSRILWSQSVLTLLKTGIIVGFGVLTPSVARALEIEMVTDPFLVSDSNKCNSGDGPHAAYVGFRVTNDTGSTVTDLEAKITGTTTDFSLTGSGNQLETQYIGTLNPNDSRTVYWHIEYPCHTNKGSDPPAPSNTFTVTVTDANTSAVIDSGTGTVTSNSSLSANAGGQIVSTELGPGAVLGQVITYDVLYSFGNVQNLDRFNIQPAGNTDFRSDCFQLLTTEILESEVNAIKVGDVDQLFYESDTAQGGSGNTAKVRYSFLYLCDGVTSTASPYSAQTSGDTNMKYTGNFEEAGTTISFPPATNSFSVTKTVTPDSLTDGGTATYTIVITNNSPTLDARIDRITDVLPSGVTFGSTTTSISGTVSEPANGDTGTIEWLSQSPDFFEIPANSSVQLVYTATIPDVDGTYTNSATAGFGVSETSPASIDVIVGAVPPTIDLDGDDSSGATNNDFNTSYTLGGSAIKVVDADNADETLDTVIADSDSTQLSQAVITLTNDPSIAGDAITIDATALSAIASGAITADTSVANQITLNGNANLADYEAALELIEFNTTATDTTTRTVTFQVTDTDNQVSNTATTNISVQVPPSIDLDYGDAPDTGAGGYETLNANGGASHIIDSNLYIGTTAPDSDSDGFGDGTDDNDDATDDDTEGTADEGSLTFSNLDTNTTSYSVTVPVFNNTGSDTAVLVGWIDFDGNGTFDSDEAVVSTGIASTGTSQDITLTWNNIGSTIDINSGTTYTRFRLSTDTDVAGGGTALSASTPNGAASDGEVEDYQLAIASGSITPELVLVKRITNLSPNPNSIDFTAVVDDGVADSSDDDPNWQNNFLQGQINVADAQPGDEVEYTIYFLSNGTGEVSNVKICDVVPDNMSFVENGFDNSKGISLFFDGTTEDLSTIANDDQGEFYSPNTEPPTFCQKIEPSTGNLVSVDSSNNNSGAVVVELDNPLPSATGSGTPSNSYGSIRFRVQVQ